jgi:diguanylate cyclase (GGDEF)-like protein
MFQKLLPTKLLGLDTLRGSLRLYAVLLVALPVALAVVFFTLFGREHILRGELTQLVDALRYERVVTHSWLEARLGDVAFMAGLDAARQGDVATLERIFADYTRTHRYVTEVVYVTTQGYTAASPIQRNGVFVGDRDYFREGREGRSAISGVLTNRASGTPLCIVSAPVADNEGHFGGVIFMPVEMTSLNLLLGEASFGRAGNVFLTDGEGRILAPAQSIPADLDQWPRVSPQVLQAGADGGLYTDAAGQEMIGAALPLDIRGWLLVREMPTDAVVAGYRRLTLWVAAGALATIILLTPLLLRLCRNLERPMMTLSRYARELRSRQYDAACTPENAEGMPLEMRELFEAFCVMADEVRGHIEETERLSIQDHLTGLYNRRFLYAGGIKLLEASLRGERACSCLMLDVDHFKTINDTYGHTVGDQVLAHIAGVIAHCVRKSDLVARYGGEEFAVLLTGAGKPQAMVLAERIRIALAGAPCRVNGHSLSVTVSIGVAEARREVEFGGGMLDDLLARADTAMYAAKAAGRDRVMVEGAGPASS